ncbi:hypothetical protein JOF56_001152 [Kibdelosporangium banguiense]|uniref:Uncharacterized protein n=1 Tax=Kibdelosporangium banguiense TaxID=1365924 RepID=A0ABS4T8M1_9PSEU|nr:hypothetical protein [Kibdelosporangium banguiense]
MPRKPLRIPQPTPRDRQRPHNHNRHRQGPQRWLPSRTHKQPRRRRPQPNPRQLRNNPHNPSPHNPSPQNLPHQTLHRTHPLSFIGQTVMPASALNAPEELPYSRVRRSSTWMLSQLTDRRVGRAESGRVPAGSAVTSRFRIARVHSLCVIGCVCTSCPPHPDHNPAAMPVVPAAESEPPSTPFILIDQFPHQRVGHRLLVNSVVQRQQQG